MPLRDLTMYSLSCDARVSAGCRVASNPDHRVLAHNRKHAHQLIRAQGWKVNDGRGEKQANYVCPDCVRAAANRPTAKRFPPKVLVRR